VGTSFAADVCGPPKRWRRVPGTGSPAGPAALIESDREISRPEAAQKHRIGLIAQIDRAQPRDQRERPHRGESEKCGGDAAASNNPIKRPMPHFSSGRGLPASSA